MNPFITDYILSVFIIYYFNIFTANQTILLLWRHINLRKKYKKTIQLKEKSSFVLDIHTHKKRKQKTIWSGRSRFLSKSQRARHIYTHAVIVFLSIYKI